MMQGSTVTYNVHSDKYLPPTVEAAAVGGLHFRMSRSVRQGFDQVVPPADDTSVRDHHGTDGYFLLF